MAIKWKDWTFDTVEEAVAFQKQLGTSVQPATPFPVMPPVQQQLTISEMTERPRRKKKVKNTQWTHEQDAQLIEVVKDYLHETGRMMRGGWKKVGRKLRRSALACKMRYRQL